jgi:hypothetical protein
MLSFRVQHRVHCDVNHSPTKSPVNIDQDALSCIFHRCVHTDDDCVTVSFDDIE